jgi:3-oxoacyl-(acyl-carrier-protein) synthase
MNHARLRRSSSITHFAVGAALEALGDRAAKGAEASTRLGIIFCVMTGCVNYSRRFYDETLQNPATASPLVFPETVFNAPSSHLASLLGAQGMNYTLVGDPGTFLQGLALAADWLVQDLMDGCLVIGAEEAEWLAVDAYRLIAPQVILGEGAGALYLSRDEPAGAAAELKLVTNSHLFFSRSSRVEAARQAMAQLPNDPANDLLVDGLQGISRLDEAEETVWKKWRGPRLSPRKVLGEGLMAAAAWQCVLAAEAVTRGLTQAVNVSVIGCNQQAIGARFGRSK